MENAHKEFQKAIGAAVCRYVPERGVLLAISRHENLHRHSSMLQEMHFRNLSQKVSYKIGFGLKQLGDNIKCTNFIKTYSDITYLYILHNILLVYCRYCF